MEGALKRSNNIFSISLFPIYSEGYNICQGVVSLETKSALGKWEPLF